MTEILNLQEACQFLRISKPMLYKYIRTGEIPAFKMGRVWRFHKASLEDWVKERMRQQSQSRVKELV